MNLLLDVPTDIFHEYEKWLEFMQIMPLSICCKRVNELTKNANYSFFLKKIQKISCGGKFTMFIKNNQLYTSGINILNAPGSFDTYPLPTQISSKNDIVSICCGGDYALITNRNEVYSIGYNKYVQLTNIKNVVASYSGYNHVLLQTKDGVLVGGKNFSGQLGLGYYSDCVDLTKNTFFNDINIIDVSLGATHTCVLSKDAVYTFGTNDRGQLGLGHYLNVCDPHEVTIEGMGIAVSCGEKHSFVLTTQGLYGSGSNIYGELGLTEPYYKKFTKIDINNVIGVKCGSDFTYVLTTDKTFVFGNSYYSQLGLVKQQPSVPVIFKHKLNINNVFCGYDHVIIENTNGKMYGLGRNEYYQLGVGKHANKKYAVPKYIKL